MFAGHNAYRFASDPFYANGFIPTVRELVERLQDRRLTQPPRRRDKPIGYVPAAKFPISRAHDMPSRPFTNALELLRAAGCGRRGSGWRWRGCCSRRATATSPPSSCTARRSAAAVPVSLATVYNTLHQFIEAGLLREVVVNPGRSYFDTNVSDHHHFFFEDTGRLLDIPGDRIGVTGLPRRPTAPRSAASTSSSASSATTPGLID